MECDQCGGPTKEKWVKGKKPPYKDFLFMECQSGCKNQQNPRYSYTMFAPDDYVPQTHPGANKTRGGGYGGANPPPAAPAQRPPQQMPTPQQSPAGIGHINDLVLALIPVMRSIDTTLKALLLPPTKRPKAHQNEEMEPPPYEEETPF